MSGFAAASSLNQSAGTGRNGRVTDAIAMASRRTGVDFGYLLGQAKVESSFNPNARAATSSATGLFQFLDQSWLGVMADHGAKHGLGWASDAIGRTSSGRFFVSDPALKQQILDLRKHPETASVMAAEFASDNRDYIEQRIGRPAEAVDLYLAHFLGSAGAAKFLAAHDANPGGSAAALFPSAARANRSVFYDRSGSPRSLGDIRHNFARKLSAGAESADATIRNGAPVAPDAFPDDAPQVMPADYLRIAQARAAQSEDLAAIAPQADAARLAYLMLATFGR